MCQQVKETTIGSMLPDMAHQYGGGWEEYDLECHRLSATTRALVLRGPRWLLISACDYVFKFSDMPQNRSTLKDRILGVFTFSTALVCVSI